MNQSTPTPAPNDATSIPSGSATATPPAPPTSKNPKTYTLKPKEELRLPAAVEKKLVKALRLKAKAGALYGEAAAALTEIMALRAGRDNHPVVVPGAVYIFRVPAVIDNKEKNSVQIVDNFAQPSIAKICVMQRHEVKTWKGHGPKEERAERAAAKFDREDALP